MTVSDTMGAIARSNWIRSLARNWQQYVVYIAFVVIFLIFAATLGDRGFLTANNLLNIARQTAIIAIMAMAVTMVLGAGEIDLSVGSVAGLASVTCGLALAAWGLPAGIAVGLGTGIIVGLINGSLTAYVGIPSFLVTLGMMGVAKGVGMWVSDTSPVPVLNNNFIFFFGAGSIGHIPILVFWIIILGAAAHFMLKKTPFGRKVLATGGGEQAARYSGINTASIKLRVLLMSGMAASLAGMLYAGRLQSGRFQLGEGDELSVIAAVVLGGTSLFGGRATVIGAIVGAFLIGVINNGLILMGLQYPQQLIARGMLIVLAVAIARRI